MNKKINFLSLAIACCCLWSISLFSQSNPTSRFWQDMAESSFAKKDAERQIIPHRYRTVRLNWEVMSPTLANAPMRFTEAAANQEILINLPMPDGSNQYFRIVEAPVLHQDLARRYPDIHAYAGQGIDDPTAYLRFDVTPMGFHAMILSGQHSGVFIDPYAKGDTNHYISYYKKDFTKESDFVCHVEDVLNEHETPEIALEENRNLLTGDCQLRTYRLALACTGEYAQFHGGTVAGVLAAMNTSMTRVNGVYEKEATITMVIIPNNDQLIFLNSANDPYDNGNGSAMLGQNQTTIDNRIGNANYDIGHVYSTGGGGIAALRSPCNSGDKAKGVTGQGNPVGDPFDIDYVAHEMGHQYGGNHTQNNDCNNVNGISVEPGSASTIMGYAGICSPNVQNNSDAYFHIINLREIANNVTNGSGSNCPTLTNTGNNAPTANAGANYTIPISTPFALTGTATDTDGLSTLTYNWEQMDPQQNVTMPPSPANTGGPMFRSITPVNSPTRYFPNLQTVVNNTNFAWEVLPNVGRTMNFTFSVRDNNITGGCVADDDMTVTVSAAAGPFLVLEPNTNVTWYVGDHQTITWDVANTNAAPVRCSEVNILLSTDGGLTYPVTLAENVANNGISNITVPNNVGNTNRVKVVCADNIFYDISNTNFIIAEPLTPTFTMNVEPMSQTVCANDDAIYQLNIASLAGFEEPVTFSTTNLPANVTATFSPNEVTPSGVTTLSLSNLAAAIPGIYTITVGATSASIDHSIEVTLQILGGAPSITALESPTDGTDGVSQIPTLTWAALEDASEYVIEIATNPAFGASVVATATVTNNNYSPANLVGSTVYYWRVKANNICGEGNFSNDFAFQTGVSSCITFESTDVPVTISIPVASTISSTLNISEDVTITDLNIKNLNIQHTWIGDLFASLTAPNDNTIVLFDRPGLPDVNPNFGCDGSNLEVSLDDDAAATAEDLEGICEDAPAISGDFQPIEPLSTFIGTSTQGDWTLVVTDNADQDGGQLNSWALEVCFAVPLMTAPEVVQNPLLVEQGTMATVSNQFLQASSEGSEAAGIVFTLTTLPANGTLILNGVALGIGDTFTQADIDNGLIIYLQNGENANADNFQYDVLDTNAGWQPGNIFNIIILINDLAVTANVNNQVSCNGASDGSLSVEIMGGTAPYTYSIDGENFQVENIFTGLNASTFVVTILDANGLSSMSNEINITQPTPLTISATVNENSITATANGGTGNYQYSINGENFQNDPTFLNLDNGNYTITTQDENGCRAMTSAIVAVDAIVAVAVLVDDISCTDANDGSLSVSVGGGVVPFQYSLDGENFQNEAIFTNLAAGVYSIVVMDNTGQTTITNEVTITNPSALTASAEANEATITIAASGGTGVLTYSINGVNFQIGNIFTNLTNGDYTITVRDENGCTTTTSATVAVNTLVVTASIIAANLCFGDATGVISAEVMGGTAPFQYSLDGENFQDSPIFTGLTAGTYNIVIIDNEGFTQTTNEVTLMNPTQITATATVIDNNITVIANGGTGSLSYSTDGLNFQTDNIFENLPNGDYTITVIDENGCLTTLEEQVNIILSISTETTPVSCNGAADGSLVITAVEGGFAPYTYSLNESEFQSDNAFPDLVAGNYNLTVRDANGDEFTFIFMVENPALLIIEVTTMSNDLTISASGGTGNFQYSIDGGITFGDANTFMDLENGIYEVVVMDDNGCQATDSVEIMVSGVADLNIDLFLDIQPNPTQGNFTMVLQQPTQAHLTIQIIDALGRVVLEQQVLKTTIHFQQTIDLQDFAQGVYFLKVSDGELLGIRQVLLVR